MTDAERLDLWEERAALKAEVERLRAELSDVRASRNEFCRQSQAKNDEIDGLLAELERLRGVVGAIRGIHRPALVSPTIDAVCNACWTDVWPCETRAALAELEAKP
jgi:septal ring factor EnvC (AmiA/AmiB activator)